MRHDVPAEDVATRHLDLLGEPPGEVARRRPLHPQRREVLLPVEGEAVVLRAVEVDGQLRDPQDRVAARQKSGADTVRCRGVTHGHAAGEREVAVEPGVEQRPAVDLDTEQLPAGARQVGLRLDVQGGAVGVRAHDPEGLGGRVLTLAGPRDERPTPHQVVAPWPRGDGVGLVEPAEAGLLEQPARLQHGVEGGGRGVDEGHETSGLGVGVERGQRGRHHPATVCRRPDTDRLRRRRPGAPSPTSARGASPTGWAVSVVSALTWVLALRGADAREATKRLGP